MMLIYINMMTTAWLEKGLLPGWFDGPVRAAPVVCRATKEWDDR